MKILKWLVLLLCVGVGGAFAMGMRINFQAIPAHLESQDNLQLLKIEFHKGNPIVAALLEETDQGLSVDMLGSQVFFAHEEIKSTTPLSEEDLLSDEYAGMVFKKPLEPIIFFDKEKSVFHLPSEEELLEDYSNRKGMEKYKKMAEEKKQEQELIKMMEDEARRNGYAKKRAWRQQHTREQLGKAKYHT